MFKSETLHNKMLKSGLQVLCWALQLEKNKRALRAGGNRCHWDTVKSRIAFWLNNEKDSRAFMFSDFLEGLASIDIAFA